MVSENLIAAPLRVERYHRETVHFQTIIVMMKNTRILHYQVFAGHIPAMRYV